MPDPHKPDPTSLLPKGRVCKQYYELLDHKRECKLCRLQYSLCTSSTVLKRHLYNRHGIAESLADFCPPEVEDVKQQNYEKLLYPLLCDIDSAAVRPEPPADVASPLPFVLSSSNTKDDGNKHRELDRLLLRMLVETGQPLSLLGNAWFKGFCSALSPGYKLPHADAMKSLMAHTYSERKVPHDVQFLRVPLE